MKDMLIIGFKCFHISILPPLSPFKFDRSVVWMVYELCRCDCAWILDCVGELNAGIKNARCGDISCSAFLPVFDLYSSFTWY